MFQRLHLDRKYRSERGCCISLRAPTYRFHFIPTQDTRRLPKNGIADSQYFYSQDRTTLVTFSSRLCHTCPNSKAHLYSILDILPHAIQLKPRVPAAIMLNILGGVREDSHGVLVNLSATLYDNNMDAFLHLYGLSSKPGRKIGHVTTTTYSSQKRPRATYSPFG